jgi:hypothetical protein
MGKTLIFGHTNPDTDSICSALAYADLKTKIGADVEAVRLGAVSAETQFVLDTFTTEAPRLVESVAGEATQVILVDHNERQQSASDIGDVTIAEVAHAVAQTVGYIGAVTFDKSKPDGAPRKWMDSSKLNLLGWTAQMSLSDGLSMAYDDFVRNHIN